MMNKALDEWTVTEVDDFLRSTGMMDLSHLSHQEKLQIIRVLKRDEKVLKTESTRVLKLKKEVQELKQKSALKPGDDADRICVRCRSELGLILNTGAECFKCHFMVCKNCRVVVTEDGLTWLCILCAKQAKLRTISGEWFYEKVSDRLKPQFESYVHGSNVVRDSLRQKKAAGSPEKRALHSALKGARNRTSSASGITTREHSTVSLSGSGSARENGTDAASDSITVQTKRVPSINRGASFDGYTNSGNSYGDGNHSSDNYEHEQPQRRCSPHGDSISDGLGNNSSNNAGDSALQAAGSNSSLQHDNLELGSRPSGYSCSVPATPEHKKSSNWMQHPRMQFPPHMTSLHESYGLPQRHRRGGVVPYGGYRMRHPVGGPHMPAGGPYRHPAQYRSLPPQSFGYFPPRFRGRPMPPGGFPSSRYSSQEDFRGSSKSLAIYPSEYHSSALDMHEQSQSQPPPAHHRFGFRGSRIGGSRESLDVQMQAAQNRESRSLSRSYPTEGSTRHPRASSLPPPEDHLGEDEQVLNFVEPLSSSHVPSLVNTLTPPRITDDGGQQFESITPSENPVSAKKEEISKGRGLSSETSSDKKSQHSKAEPTTRKKSSSTSTTMHLLKSSTKGNANKERSAKVQKSAEGVNNSDSLFTSLFSLEDYHLSLSQSERSLRKIPKQPEEPSSSYLAKNPKTASTISLTGTFGLSPAASTRGSQASPAASTHKRSSSQSSLVSIGSAKERLRKSGKRLSASFQKLTTHKKANVSIRDPKDFENEFCEATSWGTGRGKCPEDLLGSVEYSLLFDASTKAFTVGNLAFCESQEVTEGHEKGKLNNSSIYVKVTCSLPGYTLKGKTEKVKIVDERVNFPEKLKFELPKPKLTNASLRVMVLRKSQIGKDTLVGESHKKLDERTEHNRTVAKYPLTLYAANEEKDIGTIKLSVRLIPSESVNLRVSAQGLPSKGSSLPNTYCKLHLLPLPTKFKSQGIVKHSADPVYLETIVIPFRGSSLSDFCLELCIVYSGPANVKNVLGGVRLSNGTATYQGVVVEWMQSTVEEVSFWQRLQNSAGEWVQGHLRLRSNFTPLK